MLKFERQLPARQMAIRINEGQKFLDLPFVRALGWSALFHLCLFTCFRIKINDFRELTLPLSPIAVAIEQDSFPIYTTVLENESAGQSLIALSDSQWDEYRLKQALPFSNSTLLVNTPQNSSYGRAVCDAEVASWLKAVVSKPALYPLQLKVSSSLKQLKLLEDGSCLFKEKKSAHDLNQIFFSSSRFPIEYQVTIEARSGKVIRSSRQKELLDKQLQLCGDTLIKKLRFATFEKESIQGTISLIFCCTGEELQPLLKTALHD